MAVLLSAVALASAGKARKADEEGGDNDVTAGMEQDKRSNTFHEADVKLFLTLFSLCGHCEEAPEKYLDAITSPEKWRYAVTQ